MILNFFMMLARLIFLSLFIGTILFGRKKSTYISEIVIYFLIYLSTFSKILWIIFIFSGSIVLLSSIINCKVYE